VQGREFQGSGDGGARKDQMPSQLTHEEVKRMAAEGRHAEIVKAQSDGRLQNLMKSN